MLLALFRTKLTYIPSSRGSECCQLSLQKVAESKLKIDIKYIKIPIGNKQLQVTHFR